jgi:hypothetical protein
VRSTVGVPFPGPVSTAWESVHDALSVSSASSSVHECVEVLPRIRVTVVVTGPREVDSVPLTRNSRVASRST